MRGNKLKLYFCINYIWPKSFRLTLMYPDTSLVAFRWCSRSYVYQQHHPASCPPYIRGARSTLEDWWCITQVSNPWSPICYMVSGHFWTWIILAAWLLQVPVCCHVVSCTTNIVSRSDPVVCISLLLHEFEGALRKISVYYGLCKCWPDVDWHGRDIEDDPWC